MNHFARPRLQALEPRAVPATAAAGDFDGDGLADVAAIVPGRFSATLVLYRGRDGLAGPGERVTAAFAPVLLAAGDFDGDGTDDLAVVNRFGFASTLWGGDAPLRRATAFVRAGEAPVDAVAADLDGDGRDDLAVIDYARDQVRVLLGGDGGLSRAGTRRFDTAPRPLALAAGDLDGDDLPDLIVVGAGNLRPTVDVLLNRGDGRLFDDVTADDDDDDRNDDDDDRDEDDVVDVVAVAAGDFDGDGFLDVAVADTYARTITVRFGDGLGAFDGGVTFDAGVDPVVLLAADFDGDGFDDLAALDDYGRSVEFFFGGAGGDFDGPFSAGTGDDLFDAALVVDDDGTPGVAALTDDGPFVFSFEPEDAPPPPGGGGGGPGGPAPSGGGAIPPAPTPPVGPAFDVVPTAGVTPLLEGVAVAGPTPPVAGVGPLANPATGFVNPATIFGPFSLGNPTSPVVTPPPAQQRPDNGRYGVARDEVPAEVIEGPFAPRAAAMSSGGGGDTPPPAEIEEDLLAYREGRPALTLDVRPGRDVAVLVAPPGRPLFPAAVLTAGTPAPVAAAPPAERPRGWLAAAVAAVFAAGGLLSPAGRASPGTPPGTGRTAPSSGRGGS